MPKKTFQKQLKTKTLQLELESIEENKTEHPSPMGDRLSYTALNSLSAHIAVLDENGVILETNRAWKSFGMANDIEIRPDTVGVNYLALCDNIRGDSAQEAHAVARGIRDVIKGKIEEFLIDYACHSPEEKRWFYMRAKRLTGAGPLRVVLSHENITPLKFAEKALEKRESDLQAERQKLQDSNTALKVLLERREEDKRELEEKVLSNVKELILPYIEKMGNTPLNARQVDYLTIIRTHLEEVISPFLRRLSSRYLHLTPQEIQVATLVKEGRTTKEIAEILSVSTNAIDFHRKNIRKKFGLKKKETNLRSYLLSFDQ